MRLSGKNRVHMIDLLFILALFCVFAASALMVVLIGAQVYKGTVERMNTNFDERASLTYVTNKIRQNDRPGGIELIDLGEGVTGLALKQNLDGVIYQTVIYHYEGALREVFVEEGLEFSLSGGQSIVEVDRFYISQKGSGLYSMETVDKTGNSANTLIYSRCN